jgi:glutathione S-transferase
MVTVHHLENSRSQRILWLLEELAVPYDVRRYERDPETQLAPAELTAIHPLGKAPIVTDGDTTVAESGAIIEYLVERYGDGRLVPPEGSPAHGQYRYFMHYAEGSFMPLMVLSLIMSRIESAPVPFFLKPVTRGIADKVRKGYLDHSIERNLDFLEATLAASTWFTGEDLTAADVQMSFAVEAAAVRNDLSGRYPNLAAFLERVRERPAYRAALEKGGPYSLLDR